MCDVPLYSQGTTTIFLPIVVYPHTGTYRSCMKYHCLAKYLYPTADGMTLYGHGAA
jgi:hypothetical protein